MTKRWKLVYQTYSKGVERIYFQSFTELGKDSISGVNIAKTVDPRLLIIREDLGALPYHNSPEGISDFEKTQELNKKIQHLRDGGFGVVLKDFDENSMVTVLAEDGLFEEFLSDPVALYAQMMWDSSEDINKIMHTVAQMPDVDFV